MKKIKDKLQKGEPLTQQESLKLYEYIQKLETNGTWIKSDSWSRGVGMGEVYGYYYKCSECNRKVKNDYDKCNLKFCPNCGAKMMNS